MDEGRDEVLAALTDLAAAEPRLRLVEALGRNYPRVLAAVDVVVGNSSSGIIEAATAHVPAVDVGERQRGRLRGANVIHAREGRDDVEAALAIALSPSGRTRAAAVVNPYGSGRASARILDIVRGATAGSRVKPFVDTSRTGPFRHQPDGPRTERERPDAGRDDAARQEEER
jgi:UDP-N-acetylglucosamine 2-epimerase (non-hydrolysing)